MSPMLLLPATGRISIVLSTPRGCPVWSRNALPESPGMPGVAVATLCDQPPVVSLTHAPVFGLNCVTPPRSSELPYEYTFWPEQPVVLTPATGPPQKGIVGSTLPTSAESSLMSARSLYWQVSDEVGLSPAARIRTPEL